MRIIASGADIKNRILFARNGSLGFGPDLGDLSQADNFTAFKKAVKSALKKTRPDIIACDLHPGYFSSVFVRDYLLPAIKARPLTIQHHHAHIASVMQEHKLERPVIGVSFDGTGYGTDGNSWGGEFLLVSRSGFERLGHLKYRPMPGADRVVYEPWRMVLSILGYKAAPFLKKVKDRDKKMILAMIAGDINSPQTSSAGRLFDAASALLGICLYASYEAEGPIKLEAICDQRIKESYNFGVASGRTNAIDTDEIFLGMLKDLKKGKSKGLIASKFHNSMAQVVVKAVRMFSQSCGVKDVALSGGVFQNRFLKQRVLDGLSGSNFRVWTNVRMPVNDFNISLGQYYVSCGTSKS